MAVLLQAQARQRAWRSPTCAAPSWRRHRSHRRRRLRGVLLALVELAPAQLGQLDDALADRLALLLLRLAITAACASIGHRLHVRGQVGLDVGQLDLALAIASTRSPLPPIALSLLAMKPARAALTGAGAAAAVARRRGHRWRRGAVADRGAPQLVVQRAPARRRSASARSCMPPSWWMAMNCPPPSDAILRHAPSVAWSLPHWIVCSWIPLLGGRPRRARVVVAVADSRCAAARRRPGR